MHAFLHFIPTAGFQMFKQGNTQCQCDHGCSLKNHGSEWDRTPGGNLCDQVISPAH